MWDLLWRNAPGKVLSVSEPAQQGQCCSWPHRGNVHRNPFFFECILQWTLVSMQQGIHGKQQRKCTVLYLALQEPAHMLWSSEPLGNVIKVQASSSLWQWGLCHLLSPAPTAAFSVPEAGVWCVSWGHIHQVSHLINALILSLFHTAKLFLPPLPRGLLKGCCF